MMFSVHSEAYLFVHTRKKALLSSPWTLLCLMVTLLLVLSPTAQASKLTLPSRVTIEGPVVHLSDVFTGIEARLDADIAQSPAPCHETTYDLPVLKRLAIKYHLDWEPQPLHDAILVRSACTRIPLETIKASVEQRVTKENALKGEIDVSLETPTADIVLSAHQSAQFTLESMIFDPITRRFHASLKADGDLTVPLAGHLKVKRQVPVLSHRLQAGDVIGSTDLEFIDLPEEQVSLAILTEEKHLLGKEVRRDTEAHVVLHTQDVRLPRLVVRGSLVTLKIETPFMLLMAQGKALQDGAEGEVVRVMNTQSNRMLEGLVDGTGVVRIGLSQKLASVE